MRVYQVLAWFSCGYYGRTDTAPLSMWVPRKDSHCVSLDVGATEGLTLHLSRCECQERTHTACLLMCVPRKNSHTMSPNAGAMEGQTLRVS